LTGTCALAELPLDELRVLAELDNADAQSLFGLMYAAGEGALQNDAEAIRWYRLTAEQGYAVGQFGLENMNDRGRSIRKDDTEAVR